MDKDKEEVFVKDNLRARLLIDVGAEEDGIYGNVERGGHLMDLAALIARAQCILDKARVEIFAAGDIAAGKNNKQKKGD